ncbi:hypothetical protein OJ998_33730 [Solirubrobacter taibaiensis]|nr:hypothetical protein [Solirubrobacter taibaiensis]
MRLAVATLLAWALTCTGAHASTVAVKPADAYGPARLDFFAVAGERNDVQIDPGAQPQTVRVRDAVGLTPSGSCVAQDAQTAICPAVEFLHIELGDGDDRLGGSLRLLANVAGGDGDDELRFFSGLIEGGQGADVISGWIVDGGPGDDVLEAKTLRYSDRTEPVTVDLVAGVAGAPGEQDRVLPGVREVRTGFGPDVVRTGDGALQIDTGPGADTVIAGAGAIEVHGGDGDDTLTGGPGADTLLGDDGDDRVEGGAGADVLSGWAGDDIVDGGPGADKLYGSSGRDLILARDDSKDVVHCESEVLAGDRAVLDASDVPRLCEFVERSGPQRLEPIVVFSDAGRRRLLVSCPPRARARACTGTVRVGGDRARAFTVEPGKRVRIRVYPRRGHHRYPITLALRSGHTQRVTLDAVVR